MNQFWFREWYLLCILYGNVVTIAKAIQHDFCCIKSRLQTHMPAAIPSNYFLWWKYFAMILTTKFEARVGSQLQVKWNWSNCARGRECAAAIYKVAEPMHKKWEIPAPVCDTRTRSNYTSKAQPAASVAENIAVARIYLPRQCAN